mmetsp:Transcript_55280/g.131833  ORF Transcript_55280/g.131833 Transcript_55280/m.131833 type:complete len:216 (-) Transcript_55280:870-1517(-)
MLGGCTPAGCWEACTCPLCCGSPRVPGEAALGARSCTVPNALADFWTICVDSSKIQWTAASTDLCLFDAAAAMSAPKPMAMSCFSTSDKLLDCCAAGFPGALPFLLLDAAAGAGATGAAPFTVLTSFSAAFCGEDGGGTITNSLSTSAWYSACSAIPPAPGMLSGFSACLRRRSTRKVAASSKNHCGLGPLCPPPKVTSFLSCGLQPHTLYNLSV